MGYGAYSIAIGTDGSRNSKVGARGADHGLSYGLGVGASTVAGSSTVTSVKWEQCGCN